MHLWLEERRVCTNLCKFIHILSKRISRISFLDLIRICPKIPSKLNSFGLEVFRIDRFGLDVIELNRFGLITCERWDLCWSATLPWNIAGLLWVENHGACLWRWDRRKDRRSGWNGCERTCACCQCQMRQGMRHDTWMTIVLRTQRCAILNLEPRVFPWWNVIMLCNSVRAVFGCVLFTSLLLFFCLFCLFCFFCFFFSSSLFLFFSSVCPSDHHCLIECL